jgi:hypothetical protein
MDTQGSHTKLRRQTLARGEPVKLSSELPNIRRSQLKTRETKCQRVSARCHRKRHASKTLQLPANTLVRRNCHDPTGRHGTFAHLQRATDLFKVCGVVGVQHSGSLEQLEALLDLALLAFDQCCHKFAVSSHWNTTLRSTINSSLLPLT